MTAIVSPHACCNDGIITDLSGYGCIPGNLGLPEKYQPIGNYAQAKNFVVEDAGASVVSSDSSYSFSVMNNGTVGLWVHELPGFAWLIEKGMLEQGTGSSSKKIMSQKAITDQLFGVGQKWRDMKPHRAASTMYYNTTGRTIAVSIQATSISGASPAIIVTDTDGNSVTVGGFNLSSSSGSAQLFAIVPPGHSYIAHVDIIVWSELL